MDKRKVQEIQAELQTAISFIEKKHGIKVNMGTVRYDDKTFRLQLKGYEGATDLYDTYAVEFEKHCLQYGMQPKDRGTFFSVNGKTYKIVGLKTRNRKYPIIVEDTDSGKLFKFAAETVLAVIK